MVITITIMLLIRQRFLLVYGLKLHKASIPQYLGTFSQGIRPGFSITCRLGMIDLRAVRTHDTEAESCYYFCESQDADGTGLHAQGKITETGLAVELGTTRRQRQYRQYRHRKSC